MSLPKVFKNNRRIKTCVPLAFHTSFRIGGEAQYWYEPKDRCELGRFLKESDVVFPLFVIGAGSNLLFREGLIKKIFIHLKGAEFNEVKIKGLHVKIGAGAKMSRLISALRSKDIGGYEFLAGIPGTIGGGLVMNAGSRLDFDSVSSYREMKDVVEEIEVLDRRGNLLKLKQKDLRFSYRNSNLKPYIILSARLKLYQADRKKVQARIKENISRRFHCQDLRYPSAGSFFKNPVEGEPAGRLIDLCRLKGAGVGGARVSEKHANFIINVNHASSADVLKLMEIVRNKVYRRFKVELSPEVQIVS